MTKRTVGIRFRVLALAVLPMTILALVLGGYFTLTRVADTHTNLLDSGSALTRLIASAAEFGVLSGNTDLLRSLSNGPIKNEGVADVLFYDKDFRLLYRSQKFDVEINRNRTTPTLKNGLWHFVVPIKVSNIPIGDNPELVPIDRQSETIGWVAVLISAAPTEQREQQILLQSIVLTLVCLGISLFIANRFGHRITNPVLGLTRLIERLQRGDLDARANISHTGELRTLASGINRLAAQVQESNQQFEQRVASATGRLTQTLRHLERRNQELQLARQRADQANRAKDEFLARMSHELRTPLTSVIGFAQLLNATELDAEQQRYVQIVNRTSELLLTIIDDILDFSRLESDAIELENIDFDLEQCLFDVIDAQAPAARNKSLELIVEYPPQMPLRIKGDPSRLSQVLNNLIGNAIKFTERGCITVEVSTVLGAPDNRLNILIRDTGIGIPASRISHLFTAFTQGDNSISRRFGGSGLGLVIAHRLVELMGGRIVLESEEGSGTEVHLELPLRVASPPGRPATLNQQHLPELVIYEPDHNSRAALIHQVSPYLPDLRLLRSIEQLAELPPARPPGRLILMAISPHDSSARSIQARCDRVRAQTDCPLLVLVPGSSNLHLHASNTRVLSKPPRPGLLLKALGIELDTRERAAVSSNTASLPYPLKILVAEDNEFNRLLIRRLLQGMGARVDEVCSGQEVLDYLDQEEPDLILMDVHMPGMDGIQATRKVRESHPQLPIIALTANVVPHEHQALMKAGINDLLLKPINIPELLRALLQQCEQKTGVRNAPAPLASHAQPSLQQLVSPEQLHAEVRRLANEVNSHLQTRNRSKIRNCAHQLLGIAGMYDMPVLEDCTSELHRAAVDGSMRELWQASSRLRRVAEQEQLE